ncbi:MAG: hypothetical protein A2167_01045 [Planctomycetes bacterium RBG_13_46_10]|nr:MAG: hypothetical protein A2167_01045 [Planctomycetes bacterium RBG_13_46_10]
MSIVNQNYKSSVLSLCCINTAILLFPSQALLLAEGSRNVFYVSPQGSDAWSGTLQAPNDKGTDGPLKTPEGARDVIRTLKQTGQISNSGVTVFIRGGIYPMEKIFRLTSDDSGIQGKPIVYQAYNNEEVRLIGGKEITGFERIEDPAILSRINKKYQHMILQTNLRTQGISEFGELKPRGFGRPTYPAGLELFYDYLPMQLARWPNQGWVKIESVPDDKDGGEFKYEGYRPKRWVKADDIWLHGYWTWDWADSYVKVKSIDTHAGKIATQEPHGVYGYTAGKRYYAFNILEELDEPGEWYLDRNSGTLYFWPIEKLDDGKIFVSILQEPIISITGASNIILRGLTVEFGRGIAVEIIGGSHNTIESCKLRNVGNVAVDIRGGIKNGVIGCEIYYSGDGGIRLSGGDRKTLTPANNYACNNHIHSYSRWVRTCTPAINVEGVGNKAAHNLIHDGPQTAILFNGNEHLFEFNEIYNVCNETGDVGAIYTGRDWTARGTIIRYNYLRDINSPMTGGAMAVYLDDLASGITVFGNIFCKTNHAVVVGGGRDNIVKNNIFIDCDPAVFMDARGIALANQYIAKPEQWDMYKKLEDVNFDEPPYGQRYPELARILEDEPTEPKRNVISNNIFSGGRGLELTNDVDRNVITFENNIIEDNPGFINRASLDFRLKNDSVAYKLGFEKIPMEKIGLISCLHQEYAGAN